MMKWFAAAALFLTAAQVPQEKAPRPSGIAARINSEIITWDEIELELRTIPAEERTPELRKVTLRRLAEDELFLQEAKNYSIEVSETQVDADLEAERKRANMTMEEYLQRVNSQYGIGISEYRTILRRQRTIVTLMSRLATEPLRKPNPKLRLLLEFVSPEEMRDYFDKHPQQFKPIRQVDVVFISLQFQTPAEREEKLRLAASIRRRVEEDSPLYVLALAHMDSSHMPIKDGKRMPAYANLPYEDAPFSAEVKKLLFETMKEGEVSAPVVDGNSVALFHLQRKISENARSFEEAQPYIRRQLELNKRNVNRRILLQDLVKRSYVEPPDLFN